MTVAIQLQLPEDLVAQIRAQSSNLDREVTEAYALELFRQGRITHHQLGEALGLDRFETDAYLKSRNAFEGSYAMADLEADRRTLDLFYKKGR